MNNFLDNMVGNISKGAMKNMFDQFYEHKLNTVTLSKENLCRAMD